MKAVLISIQPKWCAKIASGAKTIEVRKTAPKIATPFKCYVYCTKGNPKDPHQRLETHAPDGKIHLANGTVFAEFICDGILPISVKYSNPEHHLANREFPFTCLTDKQIMYYLGNGKGGYGWHISDLVIYDTPKPLSKFYKECAGLDNTGLCYECENAVGEECDCAVNGRLHITKPPQSWCYVEVD